MRSVLLTLACVLSWVLPSHAAIVVAQLTSAISNVGATSYATASISPATNTCIILSVENRIAVGVSGGPHTPTATGNSLTWVQIATQTATGATPNRRSTVFRAMGAAPSSGTITIDFSGETQTHAGWSVTQFTGTDTSGTNCSGAIVQSATANDGGVLGTTATATLGAAPANANNLTYGWVVVTSNVTQTVGSGYTQRSQQTEATDGTSDLAETKLNSQSVTSTWTGNNSWVATALEIKAGACGIGLLLRGAGAC